MLSFGVALLFVLHPINVESYAWMTERKNVQYSFFFLLSMIHYLKFSKTDEKKALVLTYVWAILSLLSKAQAVVLLPVFFLIDYILKKDFKSPKIYLQKIPAFILFVGFLWITSAAQQETWGELNSSTYSQVDKLFLASHSFTSYFIKSIIPYGFSAYYPYPNDIGLELSYLYYSSIVIIPLFFFLLWKSFRKNDLQFFGLLFFFFNVILLLKFLDVPFGNYQMADRYTYLASIGILVFVLDLLFKQFPQFEKTNQTAFIGLGVIALVFGIITQSRIKVWNNSQDLWTDVIDSYPKYAHAYNMRALGALASGDFNSAKRDFESLMKIDPEFEESYLNLAILYYRSNKIQEASRTLDKGISLFPENIQLLEAGFTIYLKNKQFKGAENCINDLIVLEPNNTKRILMKGQMFFDIGEREKANETIAALGDLSEAQLLLKEWDERDNPTQLNIAAELDQMFKKANELGKQGKFAAAEKIFNELILRDPTNSKAYINRGSNFAFQSKFKEAIADYTTSIELNPNEPIAYFLLATAYKDLGDNASACINYKYAASKGINVDPSLLKDCF